jgi:hypothetical protein
MTKMTDIHERSNGREKDSPARPEADLEPVWSPQAISHPVRISMHFQGLRTLPRFRRCNRFPVGRSSEAFNRAIQPR